MSRHIRILTGVAVFGMIAQLSHASDAVTATGGGDMTHRMMMLATLARDAVR